MKVEKPIFIVGVGRSGTTIFHRMLCEHPNVVWLSGFCGKYPHLPKLNKYIMSSIDLPIMGKFIKKRFLPWENYGFWEYYCKGFGSPFRDLLSSDLTNKSKRMLHSVLPEFYTKSRKRLLIKTTGWPRIRLLIEAFPDSRFIHIIRDPRAVVNSRLNEGFWTGWRGPDNWARGSLPEKYRDQWIEHNMSFVALAAIEWKILMDAYEESELSLTSKNYLTVKYEDFCVDPLKTYSNVLSFCDLEAGKEFFDKLNTYKLFDNNYKWKDDFTESQIHILNIILMNRLKKYDYK